jgi:NADH dehydrogenase (ubiquinone) Fe-S protein 6
MLGRRTLPSLNHVLRNISRPASTSTPKLENTTSSAVTKKADVPTIQQSPNYSTTWSTSQRPRPGVGSGPRFEQTAMDLQPNPPSAMELISKEPIRLVHGRKAVCDGGTSLCLLLKATHPSFVIFNSYKFYLRRRPIGSSQNLH